MQTLAAAYINNVGIRSRDRNRANRLRRLRIKNRVPGTPVVVRLPNSAVALANVKNTRLAGYARQRPRPSSTKWANHAPAQVLVSGLRVRLSVTDSRDEKKEATRKRYDK